MRISDYKGEKALYKLAEMLEPITVIITDEEVKYAKKIGVEAYLKEKNETIASLIRRLNKTGCYASPITEIIVTEG